MIVINYYNDRTDQKMELRFHSQEDDGQASLKLSSRVKFENTDDIKAGKDRFIIDKISKLLLSLYIKSIAGGAGGEG